MTKAHKIPKQFEHNLTIPINVLLVEDSRSDAAYTRVMLDYTNIPYALKQIYKGQDVLPYLTRRRRFTDEGMPDLILLDLGLPQQDGFEVLSELASAKCCIRSIPVVIITGYENFAYLKNTHDLYIFDYIIKPCSADRLRRILSNIVRYKN